MPPATTLLPIGSASTTRRTRLPAVAEQLRLPLHRRSQALLQSRWGFDLNDPGAPARAEALLAASPADADRLTLVAAVRSSRGDDGGALAAARSAVAADGASSRAHATLAAILAGAGDIDGAHGEAARAVELDPADPVALFNRGVARWTVHQRGPANADFARVAQLLGERPLPWWRRWPGAR